ncbi:MAG: GNAT family N-acetyltransferase [Gammaproteobacteria bacterium]|nr:MAG: GNAT family N-acetyltransferase [Gammaproteobacteria bacterium]
MHKLNTYDIQPLTNHPHHIPTLATLWYEEISRHWVPNASVERNTHQLIEHSNANKTPMAFVALHQNQPIGMACLRENDGIRPDLTPWLGSLIVHPHHRKRKVGEMLIEAVKSQAKIFGHHILYLLAFDPTIPHWYARLGWDIIGDDNLFDHPVTVMRIVL